MTTEGRSGRNGIRRAAPGLYGHPRSSWHGKMSRCLKSSSSDEHRLSTAAAGCCDNDPDDEYVPDGAYHCQGNVKSGPRSPVTSRLSHDVDHSAVSRAKPSGVQSDKRMADTRCCSTNGLGGDETAASFRSLSSASADVLTKLSDAGVSQFSTAQEGLHDRKHGRQTANVNSAEVCRLLNSSYSSPNLKHLITKFTEHRIIAELSECRSRLQNRGLFAESRPLLTSPSIAFDGIDGRGADRLKVPSYPHGNGKTWPTGMSQSSTSTPSAGGEPSRIDLVLHNIIVRTLAERLGCSTATGGGSGSIAEPAQKQTELHNFDWHRLATDPFGGHRPEEDSSSPAAEDGACVSTGSIGSASMSSLEPSRSDAPLGGGSRQRSGRRGGPDVVVGSRTRSRDFVDSRSTSSGDDCNAGSSPTASACGAADGSRAPKKTRPKRGQYRKYNRQLLMEAVRAVQQGDMSVHRAGSFYGVPHSTLEYKVKERHLLRQRKAAASGPMADDVSSSATASPAQQQQQDVKSTGNVKDDTAGRRREVTPPDRRLDDSGISESSRSYLKQLQDAANLAAAASTGTANPWPFLFDSMADETMSLSSAAAAAAALFPWNYFLAGDGRANDPLFGASAAVLSAAARLPPLPPPPHSLPFRLFGSSLPVGFGWPPPAPTTPLTSPSAAQQTNKLNFGVFSPSAESASTTPRGSFDVASGSHVFSMSASDLLKSFQLKVQAKSAAAAAAGRDATSATTVDDCRLVSSSTAVDSFTDLMGSRCSSACSVDSPTSQVIVS
jgi:hypothetical protein